MVNMKLMSKKITKLRKEAQYFYIQHSYGLYCPTGLFGTFWSHNQTRDQMIRVLGLNHTNALVRYHKQRELHYTTINETGSDSAKFIVIAEEHIDNETRKHPKYFI